MSPPLAGHLVGADVLGDAAGLARGDVGLADGVEQRGLAVVDVAHDGDDRRARHQVLGVRRRVSAAETLVLLERDVLDLVAELAGEERRGVEVDVWLMFTPVMPKPQSFLSTSGP